MKQARYYARFNLKRYEGAPFWWVQVYDPVGEFVLSEAVGARLAAKLSAEFGETPERPRWVMIYAYDHEDPAKTYIPYRSICKEIAEELNLYNLLGWVEVDSPWFERSKFWNRPRELRPQPRGVGYEQ